LNRLLTETNQLGFTRSHSYDAVGNEIERVDRNGRKTVYQYDGLNRKTGETWIGANGQGLRATSYAYDAVDNLVGAIDPDAQYIYTYDAINQITSTSNTGTTGVPAVVFAYSYDGVGNLITVNDSINGTAAGNTNYLFDRLDRVTQIKQGGTGVSSKRIDMTYNAVSQMTGLSRFSDLAGNTLIAETNYSYDNKQRLIQLAHKRGTSTLASYDYTYDTANRLTSIVSSVDGTVNYAYDSTNQLTGADHSSQTDEAYQYDANGNRINAGYQTGINNQLLSDGQFSYEYDKEGNRTKRTEIATGKVAEYVWDYRNRLTGVLLKDAGGNVVKAIGYTYDAHNQRIGKSIDGVVAERHAVDRDQIALVFDGQGNQTHRYLYGTEVDKVLTDETSTSMVWALADDQGTIKDLLDENGAIISHITYDSFGRVVNATGNIDFRYGFTGREYDSETGLEYYRARYYDAAIGEFISEDPLGFDAGDTNLMRYVFNSPTNYTDPSGEVVWLPLIGGTILLYSIGQAFFPDNVQTPMHQCDYHPTPPDQELKRGLTEMVASGGLSLGTNLIKSTGTNLLRSGVTEIGSSFPGLVPRRSLGRPNAPISLKSPSSPQCFVAGTEILTSEGIKSIENIHVGDWVLADDPNTVGQIEYKQVLQTFNHDATQLVDIYIDGEKITTTEEHPFWVQGVGWVAAKDLTAGTHLQTNTESWLDIDRVDRHSELTTVYNFEVEGFHTYFVSDLGLLVHNTCYIGPEYSSPIDPRFPGRPDPLRSIDTSRFPSGEPTKNGGLRDNIRFWKEWIELNPQTISNSNRYKIEQLGLSPKVDKQWIQHYPDHGGYKNQTIIHHHVDQGPYAIPVPQGTHVGSGGPFHY
jgi:RHS repeat-associated protein